MKVAMRFTALLAFIAFFETAECAITAWTKPDIGSVSGSGTLDEKINNGVTSTTGISIAATGSSIVYVKVSQSPSDPELAIDGSSGAVTVTSGTVSYSASTSLEMVVTAAEGSETATATATVTINVNAAPVITSHSSTPCIADASTEGTDLIDLAATDSNSGTTFAWAIESAGNTNTDFTITSSGVVEVNSAKTLDMATTPSYTLVITAADDSSTPLTATTTVTASLQTTCPNSSAVVAVSVMTLLAALVVTKLF